jgi:hypothetical protein
MSFMKTNASDFWSTRGTPRAGAPTTEQQTGAPSRCHRSRPPPARQQRGPHFGQVVRCPFSFHARRVPVSGEPLPVNPVNLVFRQTAAVNGPPHRALHLGLGRPRRSLHAHGHVEPVPVFFPVADRDFPLDPLRHDLFNCANLRRRFFLRRAFRCCRLRQGPHRGAARGPALSGSVRPFPGLGPSRSPTFPRCCTASRILAYH